MSVRKPAPDPTTAEMARRRLRQLGAELSPPSSSEPSASTSSMGPTDRAGVAEVPQVRGEPVAAAPAGGGAPRSGRGRHARARLSPVGRARGRVGDALPPTLHGRLRLTSQHVTVVALVLAAAMALAAWLLVRSVPEPPTRPPRASLQLPVTAPKTGTVVTASTASTASATPAAAAAPTALAAPTAPAATGVAAPAAGGLVVHVVGKVRRPGVVELPSGARVVDAIKAAGGAKGRARLGSLNLARPVVDGEQIAVGVPGAVAAALSAQVAPTQPLSSAVPGAPAALVDLNTATQVQLEELPGVGPVTATSIIEWRTEHGGFSTVDELLEVSGIGEVTLGELRDLVTV